MQVQVQRLDIIGLFASLKANGLSLMTLELTLLKTKKHKLTLGLHHWEIIQVNGHVHTCCFTKAKI